MSIEEFVKKKIKSGVYKLVNNEKGTSPMWSIYAMIAEENGLILDGYIYCRKCNGLIKYKQKSKQNAYRHKCFVGLKDSNDIPIAYDENDESQNELLINENDSTMAADNEKDENLLEVPAKTLLNKDFMWRTETKIRDGSYKLRTILGRRSSVWSFFKEICQEDGTAIKGVVWCPHCEKLLINRGSNNSSSNLLRHKCRLERQQQQLDEDETPPPIKIAKVYEERNDSNEGTHFFSESDDIFTEEKTTVSKESFSRDDYKDENAASETDFVCDIKLEEEKFADDELQCEDGITFNLNDEIKNCSNYIEIANNLRTGAYTLMPKVNVKSLVWNTFDLVVKEDGNIAEGYVCCRGCKKLLKFNGKSTSNLHKHKCVLEAAHDVELKIVSDLHKKDAIKICSQWIIQDCLPCNVLEGEGFRKMLKFFIKLGSVYGKHIDIPDMIPGFASVAENLKTMANEKKSKIKDFIEKNSENFSVSLDLWSNNRLNTQYLSAALHYQTNGMLSFIQIGPKSIDVGSYKKDIFFNLENLLNEFNAAGNIKNVLFVTNGQKELKDALKGLHSIVCSYTLFSTTVDTAIERTDCKYTIDKWFEIVKISKEKNIQVSINPGCHVQCGFKYNLIRSIAGSWSHLQTLRESIYDFEVLDRMVKLFKKFEFIFKKLQDSETPSLCFVIPSINCIKALCEEKPGDEELISDFKINLLECLNEIWIPNITMWHKAAYFLYPPANKEQLSDFNKIKDFCIEQIMKMDKQIPISNEKTIASTSDSDSDESNNNEDISFFFPALVKKSRQNTVKTPNEEITRYSLDNVMIDGNFNALQWWQNNTSNYPKLSKLAMRILSLPATSTMAVQRLFALAEQLALERLNQFTPETVKNILLLNSLYNKNL